MILAVANQKGGVGKTTMAWHLAAGLASAGHWTLLIDLDPQGNLGSIFGLGRESRIWTWLIEGGLLEDAIVQVGARLDLVPGDKSTATAMGFLIWKYKGEVPVDLLAGRLRGSGYRYVVIDTAPSASEFQAAAMYAADVVLVPAACDFLSEEGVVGTLETLRVTTNGQGLRPAVVVPTFFDARTTESRRVLNVYRRRVPQGQLLAPIHVATRFKDAMAAGQTVFDIEPRGRPAAEMAEVVDFVLRLRL